jgi:hypothetical protein
LRKGRIALEWYGEGMSAIRPLRKTAGFFSPGVNSMVAMRF